LNRLLAGLLVAVALTACGAEGEARSGRPDCSNVPDEDKGQCYATQFAEECADKYVGAMFTALEDWDLHALSEIRKESGGCAREWAEAYG
jgi:hypothetical protein